MKTLKESLLDNIDDTLDRGKSDIDKYLNADNNESLPPENKINTSFIVFSSTNLFFYYSIIK